MFCTPSEMPSSSARRIFSALMESLPRWDCLKRAMPRPIMTIPTTIPTMRRVVGFWVVEMLMKRPPDLFFSIITLQEGRRNQYCTIICSIVENSLSQVFFQPGLVQPLADDDEHLLSLRDGGCRQTGGGSIQLIPLAIILHEAFHTEDISAGGVGEE